MKLQHVILTALLAPPLSVAAQQEARDSIEVQLTNTTKMVLTIGDRNDLEALKELDFQQLFDDLLLKFETQDTTPLVQEPPSDPAAVVVNPDEPWEEVDHDADGEESTWHWNEKEKFGRTTQSFNFDFGTNNYLSNGEFPDSENQPYSVRPWGSWYVGINSVQRTRIGKNFFMEWALGVSWYNFKFQEDHIRIEKDDNGVYFVPQNQADVSYQKSKLTVTYLNASLVPVLDFGNHGRRHRVWDSGHDSFRVGLGPYIGYRIDSYSKLKYKASGNTEKDKNHDSFYLENIRYGMRLQVGFRSTDLFFNYDLNDLFVAGKGPELNAFSFGIIF